MADVTVPETAENKEPSAQWRGETIAYAVQSGACNMAANFVEPYITYRIQQHYSGSDATHHGPHGTYTQNLAGEFAGDLIGSTTLILAEAVMPRQLHAFSRIARELVDPLYTSVAHAVLARDRGDPDYENTIERWKLFQERNLVRSTIIAASGIAGNVLTQKLLLGNPSPTSLILKGKLASTALTTTVELGARFTFPGQMSRMDKWMSQTLFAPLMGDKAMPPTGPSEGSHVERLSQPRHDQPVSWVR